MKKKICLIAIAITFTLFVCSLITLVVVIVNKPAPEVVARPRTIITQKKEPEKYYNITEIERELLAKLVHAESSICSHECKRDVCSVVFNRLNAGKWGTNLYDVIYYPNAFTPATFGLLDDITPTSSDYAAVDYVIENGTTVPTYVRYFRASYNFFWDGYIEYKNVDNVYFGYFEDWQNGTW